MQIIIREKKQLISARIGDYSLNQSIKLANQGFKSKTSVFNFLNPDEITFNPTNIESLISDISNITSYEYLPDIIRFNYNTLEENNILPSDLAIAVNFSYKMAARRLGMPIKHVVLSGICNTPISYKFKEELEKNNFAGGILSIKASSIEEKREFSSVWKKDNGFWDKRTFQEKIIEKNTFDLTFRQEQILQLIRTRGLTNVQIADMLKLSESTVKMHVGIILKKYGFRTRMQLVTNLY